MAAENVETLVQSKEISSKKKKCKEEKQELTRKKESFNSVGE